MYTGCEHYNMLFAVGGIAQRLRWDHYIDLGGLDKYTKTQPKHVCTLLDTSKQVFTQQCVKFDWERFAFCVNHAARHSVMRYFVDSRVPSNSYLQPCHAGQSINGLVKTWRPHQGKLPAPSSYYIVIFLKSNFYSFLKEIVDSSVFHSVTKTLIYVSKLTRQVDQIYLKLFLKKTSQILVLLVLLLT